MSRAADHDALVAMRAALRAAGRRQGAGRHGLGMGVAVARAGVVEVTAGDQQRRDAVTAALASLGPSRGARRATAAVTLATPTLAAHASALRRANIRTLVIGAGTLARRDQRTLHDAGVRCRRGVLEARCERIHRDVCFVAREGRPWVTLKAAASVDGMLGCPTGHSKWITGAPARVESHRLRARHDAIAVGVGTVLADDPALTVRGVSGTDPRVVVFDSELRVMQARAAPRICRPGTILLHGPQAPQARVDGARTRGLLPLKLSLGAGGGLRISAALRALARLQVRSLMVEGGGRLLSAWFQSGLWEEWWLFTAPIVLGGAAQPVFPDASWSRVDRAPRLAVVERRTVGEDWLTVLRPGKTTDR